MPTAVGPAEEVNEHVDRATHLWLNPVTGVYEAVTLLRVDGAVARVLAGEGRRVRVPHRDLIQYDEDYEGAELEEQAGVPEGDHRPSRSGSSRDGLSELGASTRRSQRSLSTSSVALAASAASVRLTRRSWRGGTAPQAPSFSGEGHNLATTLRAYETEVKVWKKLLRPRELVGDMEVVELGDRLGELFDRSRRRAGENLRDYVHRFEVMRLRLSEAGETLSERARVNRLLKGSGLSEREQRELLMSIGGQYDFGKLKVAMALYSSYFSRSSAPPTSFSAGGPRPTPIKGKSFGKGGGGKARPRQEPFRGCRVNEVAGVDEIDAGEAGIDPEDQADEYAEADLDGDFEEELTIDLDDGDEYDEAYACELEDEIHEANMILQNARRRLDNAKAAKGTLGGQGDDRRAKLAEVKKRTNCAVCGKVGHWHTDPECPDCEKTMKEKAAKGKGRGRPRVPAGAKGKGASRAHEANTVSALSSGAPVCTAGVAFLGTGAAGPPSAPLAWSWPQAREPRDHVAVMAVQHFSVVTGDTDSEGSEGYASDSGSSLQVRQVLHTIQEGWSDADLVVLDTACARSVAGKEWLTRHDQSLRDRFGFGCTVSAENEVFRFGNGQPQTSVERWRVPAGILGQAVELRFSALPGSFPPLMSLSMQASLEAP